LQSLNPALQLATPHWPPTHLPTPFAGVHLMLQPPQLFGSVENPVLLYSQPSPGIAPQSLDPGGQVLTTQRPPVHTKTAAHFFPPWPQLFGSVMKPALPYSQPSLAIPLQLLNPGAHAPSAQAPPVHSAVACWNAHTTPQPPQLFGSLANPVSSYSQPSPY